MSPSTNYADQCNKKRTDQEKIFVLKWRSWYSAWVKVVTHFDWCEVGRRGRLSSLFTIRCGGISSHVGWTKVNIFFLFWADLTTNTLVLLSELSTRRWISSFPPRKEVFKFPPLNTSLSLSEWAKNKVETRINKELSRDTALCFLIPTQNQTYTAMTKKSADTTAPIKFITTFSPFDEVSNTQRIRSLSQYSRLWTCCQ